MNETIKTATEIGCLVAQLTPTNQSYVLNTINTLLYSQNVNKEKEKEKSK